MTVYLGNVRDRVVAVGEYKVTRTTLTDGQRGELQVDPNGYLIVADYGRRDKYNDGVTSWEQPADSKVAITASAQTLSGPGTCYGFTIISHTIGATVRVSDALTATTPYVGSAFTTVAGHIAGTYIPLAKNGLRMATGCYFTITGTIEIIPDVRLD